MPTKMGTSESMVKCAFAEFLGCWAAGGEATLSLSTKKGKTTITFATSLGSPGAPLHPPLHPPSSTPGPPRRRRRRGPARRKRDQERAARHQATLATSTSSNSSSTPLLTDSVEAVAEKEKAAEVHPPRTCKRCNLPCKGHPAPGPGEGRCQVILSTPNTPSSLENFRSSTPMNDLSTSSNMDHTREEQVTPPSPEKTTTSEDFNTFFEEWKEKNKEMDRRYEERRREEIRERNKRREKKEEKEKT